MPGVLEAGCCNPNASNASIWLGLTTSPARRMISLSSNVMLTGCTLSLASFRSSAVRSSSTKVLGWIRSSTMAMMIAAASSLTPKSNRVESRRLAVASWPGRISARIAWSRADTVSALITDHVSLSAASSRDMMPSVKTRSLTAAISSRLSSGEAKVSARTESK